MRYLPLLYFPASVLLVDNNQTFLQAFQNRLSELLINKILIEQNPMKVTSIIGKVINAGYINIMDIFI